MGHPFEAHIIPLKFRTFLNIPLRVRRRAGGRGMRFRHLAVHQTFMKHASIFFDDVTVFRDFIRQNITYGISKYRFTIYCYDTDVCNMINSFIIILLGKILQRGFRP